MYYVVDWYLNLPPFWAKGLVYPMCRQFGVDEGAMGGSPVWSSLEMWDRCVWRRHSGVKIGAKMWGIIVPSSARGARSGRVITRPVYSSLLLVDRLSVAPITDLRSHETHYFPRTQLTPCHPRKRK